MNAFTGSGVKLSGNTLKMNSKDKKNLKTTKNGLIYQSMIAKLNEINCMVWIVLHCFMKAFTRSGVKLSGNTLKLNSKNQKKNLKATKN